MDSQTLQAYSSEANAFAADWLGQPFPDDLRQLVHKYFLLHQPTVDVGCGAGRDTGWLNREGYPTIGIEPVRELVELAQAANPGTEFIVDALPDLPGVKRGQFTNVFCETVLMHLPVTEIPRAVSTLISLLRPGGTLFLSWRVTRDKDQRDDYGRLYTSFDSALVTDGMNSVVLLFNKEEISLSSRKLVHRLIARAKP